MAPGRPSRQGRSYSQKPSGLCNHGRKPSLNGQTPHDRSLPTTPDELFAALDRLGIAHPTVSHPPLFTVEQSQSLRGSIAGGHTKNLFLRDKKGALFLVTALEDAAIELKVAAPAARRHRPLLVRLGRPDDGNAGRRCPAR